MLNFVITLAGVRECPGVPSIFVSDKNLRRISEDKELRAEIVRVYGDSVTVGLIGDRIGDNEFKEQYSCIEEPDTPLGGIGFYEKLNS